MKYMSKAIKQAKQARVDEFKERAEEVRQLLKKPIFSAAGELLSQHFSEQERERGTPEGGYMIRPQLGIRYSPNDRAAFIAKPGWSKASWMTDGGKYKRDENGQRIKAPGVLNLSQVDITLTSYHATTKSQPGRLNRYQMNLYINEDGCRLGRSSIALDASVNVDRVNTIVAVLHRLIDDPMRMFADSTTERCGCCGRHLTDMVSKLRGIGPECWKYFAHLPALAAQIKEKYRSLDDEWDA
jgi:hypothetical protein